MGFSVGLSALTAWGLARFNALRSTIDLPRITDPGFEAAWPAQERLTAQAIAETFTAAAVVVGAGLLATVRHEAAQQETPPWTPRWTTTSPKRPSTTPADPLVVGAVPLDTDAEDLPDADPATDPTADPTMEQPVLVPSGAHR